MKCDARFPCFIGGWGCGKSLFAILRGLRLSSIPNSVGLIVRREFVDLRDSTLHDFEEYTGMKVGSDKDVILPNKSKIMFRHGEELNVLKNINLSWFLIEQAEEFDNDEQFNFLRGRLRKGSFQSGMVIGNVRGHNWIWRLWKASPPSDDYELFEANTFDNSDNLPDSYIKDLRAMEKESPVHYKRFVLNMWDELEEGDNIISFNDIIASQKANIIQPYTKRVISCDPADEGLDETCIYCLDENGKIIDQDIFCQKQLMETVGRIVFLKKKNDANFIVVDAIGVGAGVVSRLHEMGEPVMGLSLSEKASDPTQFHNLRAEIFWYARQEFQERRPKIYDEKLISQLTSIKYERHSSGTIQIEKKEKIRKRLGCSPDRADCYCYGIWGLRFATEKEKEKKRDAYLDKVESTDYMSV